MALVEDYIRDLKEITSFDSGSRNIEGVAKAASIMKRHYDSIGFATNFVDLGPAVGPGSSRRINRTRITTTSF